MLLLRPLSHAVGTDAQWFKQLDGTPMAPLTWARLVRYLTTYLNLHKGSKDQRRLCLRTAPYMLKIDTAVTLQGHSA
jgi:hypothetical protein